MLIDIEPILDAAKLAGKEYVSIDFLKGFEQVDAVPVVRGEWIKKSSEETETLALCSKCSYPISWWYKTNFCPNCGAKMEDKPCR